MPRGRRRPGNGKGYGGAGLASSSYENECPRCGEDIVSRNDMTKANGRWIHKRCASGADDE